MRNLEECTAEVFRRSKERIQKRKKLRNRVLVCCTPICLAAVVLLAAPGDVAGDLVAPEGAPECAVPMENVEAGRPIRQGLSVSAGDRQLVLSSDPEQVSQVYEFICNLSADMETLEEFVDDGYYGWKDHKIENSAVLGSAEYTVSIALDNGETLTFALNGNKLYETVNQNEIILSESQLAKLLELLQIP